MVSVITTASGLRESRSKEKRPVGFVPTMGNLHRGHISLLERALHETTVVYFSIFVNPKQFGPAEDYHQYPRTLESDLKQIEVCALRFPDKEIIVFAPTDPMEVFPVDYDQVVSVRGLNSILEGSFRPGHFDGVTTVVYKLFELVRPSRAYFGLKDYQQFIVIRQMIRDLQLPIEIIGMPIVREESGLAMSSRNQFLSAEQKHAALALHRGLTHMINLIGGQRAHLPAAGRERDILLTDSNWNYLEIRDAETLSDDLTHAKRITILGVYQLGQTRLLDNAQTELA